MPTPMRRFRSLWEPEAMRALHLDFRREDSGKKLAGIAIFAAGIAAALASGAQYSHVAEEIARLEAGVHQSGMVARRQAAAQRPAIDGQKVALEIKRASEVAYELKLPWNELFASVEAAKSPDVALLSIESDTGKRRLKIAAEAKDLQAMLVYLRVLGAQPKLANIYLQNHQVQRQDPQQPVRFVLGADWNGGLR
jgi:hypothetical protein